MILIETDNERNNLSSALEDEECSDSPSEHSYANVQLSF